MPTLQMSGSRWGLFLTAPRAAHRPRRFFLESSLGSNQLTTLSDDHVTGTVLGTCQEARQV